MLLVNHLVSLMLESLAAQTDAKAVAAGAQEVLFDSIYRLILFDLKISAVLDGEAVRKKLFDPF